MGDDDLDEIARYFNAGDREKARKLVKKVVRREIEKLFNAGQLGKEVPGKLQQLLDEHLKKITELVKGATTKIETTLKTSVGQGLTAALPDLAKECGSALTASAGSALGGLAKGALGALADKTGASDAVGDLKGKLPF
jgi:translation elongation factor EF-Ts